MRSACLFGVVAAGTMAASASGAYMVSVTSNGMSSRNVQPGNSFQLDIVLTGATGDQINSAITRLVFSEAGLQYDGYDWSTPFENGSITDDSVPVNGNLPALLDADTLSGVGYPGNTVDIELSNVVLTSARFGSGVLVSLTLTVPASWSGEEMIEINAAPDTFANGFTEIPATAGPAFTLIIPTPAASALALAAGAVACGRRRR